MPNRIKKIIRIALPLSLGLLLVWYSFYRLTPEQLTTTLGYIKSASPFWVGLSILLGLLSHFSRAWRWKYLLAPMGYQPRFINSLLTVLVAYLLNLGIPRAGEISRAAGIASYEKIPFNRAFGTIIAERVVDLIILFLLIFLAIVFQTDDFLAFLVKKDISLAKIITAACVLVVVAGVGLYILKKSKIGIIVKIRRFLEGIWEGFRSVKDTPHQAAFWFHTLLIWFLYLMMFYAVMLSFPEMNQLPFIAVLTAFVIGGLSMSATNGGIGVYPIAIQQILLTYGVTEEVGLAFGWVIWIAQTVLVIFFGFLSFMLLPVVNRKRYSE